MDIRLIGAPLQIGAGQLGCEMGPSAYRIAGLTRALEDLGHRVVDTGNVTPAPLKEFSHPNPAVHHLAETVAWTEALTDAAYRESASAVP
ncbi:arginase family protein, partial [Rhizobium sp.]